ncbi:MAG: pantoate--beta-alanine ligase [Chloroflexi bacterium]|nr:pantoate--beta-alanine ligase [Chloroflexota bacterium]
MRIAATVAEMRAVRRDMTGDVGFVPTLGALHEGHLSLVRAAREQNQHTVASIFVNPTQFGDPDDFASYPRDPERDLALLRDEGVDIVFLPESAEIYPADASTFVEVEHITDTLEGEHRPGHFRGVATVVTKLFQIVRPQRAYFGRKDAQQLAVIRRLVRDLHFDIEIVAVPTVREPDGLAMSSRNALLSVSDRQAALVLSRALRRAEELFAAGERDGETLRSAMRGIIAAEPQAQVDYVSVADTETLRELARVEHAALASLAVRIGGVRLIDNVELKSE